MLVYSDDALLVGGKFVLSRACKVDGVNRSLFRISGQLVVTWQESVLIVHGQIVW